MMNISDFSISEVALELLCERFGVKELALFGSRAREDYASSSDVDILVEFFPESEIGYIGFDDLREGLASLFDRKVDLVSKRGLKPRVRAIVLPQSKSFYHASR